MALGHIHLRFAWQAWHLWHWAGSGGGLWPVLVAGDAAALCVTGAALATSRGRRGTWRHPASFRVAVVALMALGWLWWSFPRFPFLLSLSHSLPPFPFPFSLSLFPFSFPFLFLLFPFSFLLSLLPFPSPLQMERGAKLCVAGVPLGDIHLSFAWQAWHLVTSTFVLLGKRGTYGTGLALVARLGRS